MLLATLKILNISYPIIWSLLGNLTSKNHGQGLKTHTFIIIIKEVRQLRFRAGSLHVDMNFIFTSAVPSPRL